MRKKDHISKTCDSQMNLHIAFVAFHRSRIEDESTHRTSYSMNHQTEEIQQELQRISRRSTVTAWVSSVIAAGMVASHFFPKVMQQLAESTESLDRAIAPHLRSALGGVIFWAFILGLPGLCIWYVLAKISGAKKP